MTGPSVVAVVLNWRGAEDTLTCVESLTRTDWPDLGIVVCDNASGDGSFERIREGLRTGLPGLNAERAKRGLLPYDLIEVAVGATPHPDAGLKICLIETGGNLGYAGGNNVGIRWALGHSSCRHVWVLNNDTIPEPAALNHMLVRMEADPTIGLCGATLCYLDKPDLIQNRAGGVFSRLTGRANPLGAGERRSDRVDAAEVERRLDFVSGASALVSRPFLEATGLMYEGYFLYFEELDWARQGGANWRLGYAPHAVVFHKVGSSIGTNDFGHRSALSEFYLRRNRVRFCWRWSKLSLPFVIIDIAKDVLKLAFAGQWARAQLVLLASLQLPRRSVLATDKPTS